MCEWVSIFVYLIRNKMGSVRSSVARNTIESEQCDVVLQPLPQRECYNVCFCSLLTTRIVLHFHIFRWLPFLLELFGFYYYYVALSTHSLLHPTANVPTRSFSSSCSRPWVYYSLMIFINVPFIFIIVIIVCASVFDGLCSARSASKCEWNECASFATVSYFSHFGTRFLVINSTKSSRKCMQRLAACFRERRLFTGLRTENGWNEKLPNCSFR